MRQLVLLAICAMTAFGCSGEDKWHDALGTGRGQREANEDYIACQLKLFPNNQNREMDAQVVVNLMTVCMTTKGWSLTG
jgi:hypothetical protein